MAPSLRTVVRAALALWVGMLLVGLRPLWPLQVFWPWPLVVILGVFALSVLFHPVLLALWRAFMRVPARVFLPSCMVVAFGVALWANWAVLDQVPHVTDSVAYYVQAKVFASGNWTAAAPPCPECFLPHFFYSDGDRLISLFQPGWPAVLALGMVFGVPWLVNPLLGALSLWPLYRLARSGFGEETARLTIVFWLVSPFYVYMTASFMGHPLSALLSLWALERTLYWRKTRAFPALALAGVLLGLLALARIYNALLAGGVIALLVAASLVWEDRRRQALWDAVRAFALCAALVSLQFVVNADLTGDPWRFSQDEYFRLTEQEPTCHRLGFGSDVGCEREHGEQHGFRKGYYVTQALTVTRQRLDSLALNLYGLPWALWLMVIPLAAGPLGRTGRAALGMTAAVVGGYFLFYYHGNCYGPRFYYEITGLLVMFMVVGLVRLDALCVRAARAFPNGARVLSSPARVLGLTLLVFTFVWMHPALKKNYSRFRGLDAGMLDIVEDAGISNAVVLVPGSSVGYAYGLIHHDPTKEGDVIYARHLWDQSVTLMYVHPDREFYRYEPLRDVLVKVRRHDYAGLVYSEFETKLPPLDYHDGQVMLQDITHLRPHLREALQLYFRARGPGAWLEVLQDVMETGDHYIEIEALRGPFNADWELEIDGAPLAGRFEGYATEYGFATWRSAQPVSLRKGRITLRIRVTGRDAKALGFGVGLDHLTLRRADVPFDRPVPRVEDLGYMEKGRLVPIGPEGIPWEKWPGWKRR